MEIKNSVWRRISAGLIGSVAVCCLAGGFCSAKDKEFEDRPPGSRQFEYKGKLWPPFPRPTGKEPKFIQQYHYAHYWPYPQNCEDQRSVQSAMNAQISNGWVEATTLHSYHFDPETNQLSTSGLAHLEYILFRTPATRRTVFIQNSASPQVDQTRLASVQNTAGAMLQNDGVPLITFRRARSYGTSAEEVDMITRKYISGTPTPRLGVGMGTAGGQAGGGGGGGGGSGE